MKKPKLILALFVLLASFQIGFGQEKPALELVEKLDTFECEYVIMRLDSFMVQLRNEPDAVGYVIFSRGEDGIKSDFYEGMLANHFKSRRFPLERVKFVNAAPEQKFQAELWISRRDAKPAVVKESADNLTLKPLKSRYLFADDNVQAVEVEGKQTFFTASECSPKAVNFYRLAAYLNANPEIRAEIFVYNQNKKRAAQIIKLFADEATNEHKISPARLKIMYGGIDKEAVERYDEKISTVKIWLVPSGEKK